MKESLTIFLKFLIWKMVLITCFSNMERLWPHFITSDQIRRGKDILLLMMPMMPLIYRFTYMILNDRLNSTWTNDLSPSPIIISLNNYHIINQSIKYIFTFFITILILFKSPKLFLLFRPSDCSHFLFNVKVFLFASFFVF